LVIQSLKWTWKSPNPNSPRMQQVYRFTTVCLSRKHVTDVLPSVFSRSMHSASQETSKPRTDLVMTKCYGLTQSSRTLMAWYYFVHRGYHRRELDKFERCLSPSIALHMAIKPRYDCLPDGWSNGPPRKRERVIPG
jgi:hypothetical protein